MFELHLRYHHVSDCMVSFSDSCFPLQNDHFKIHRKLKRGRRNMDKKMLAQSCGNEKDANNSLSSTGTDSDADAALPGVPVMNLQPPSLPDSGLRLEEIQVEEPLFSTRSSHQPSLKASSLSELSNHSNQDTIHFMKKLNQAKRHPSLVPGTEASNVLQLQPLLKAKLPSESSLWKRKNNTASEQNLELYGSSLKITQGVQVQQRKKEKVAQVTKARTQQEREYSKDELH